MAYTSRHTYVYSALFLTEMRRGNNFEISFHRLERNYQRAEIASLRSNIYKYIFASSGRSFAQYCRDWRQANIIFSGYTHYIWFVSLKETVGSDKNRSARVKGSLSIYASFGEKRRTPLFQLAWSRLKTDVPRYENAHIDRETRKKKHAQCEYCEKQNGNKMGYNVKCTGTSVQIFSLDLRCLARYHSQVFMN